jgi:hypothetical protein
MDGRMHPAHQAQAVVDPLLAAHPAAQQVGEQQLLGEGQERQLRI